MAVSTDIGQEQQVTQPKQQQPGTVENGAYMSDEDESIPPISQQRTIIHNLISQRMQKSQVWCLISTKWLNWWKHYVKYDLVNNEATSDAMQQDEGATENGDNDLPEGSPPGPIDNRDLLLQPSENVISTPEYPVNDIAAGEDATVLSQDDESLEDPFVRKVREDAVDKQDYELIPKEAYQKLASWYGGGPEIARRVVSQGDNKDYLVVEVHPHFLLVSTNKDTDYPNTFLNYKEVSFSKYTKVSDMITELKEQFNIDKNAETRLWRVSNGSPYELFSKNATANLDDVNTKQKGQKLLLEVKQGDKWVIQSGNSDDEDNPILSKTTRTAKLSNMEPFASGQSSQVKAQTSSSYLWENEGDKRGGIPGVCGLSNLGNTCFMNSALQCLTKTMQLNKYFVSDEYKREINESNPLGMGGQIAVAFGNLMKEMWSGRHTCITPREFKWTIGKFAPQFSGYQQQDSQELIAYLLDGLHEDLNRILKKPVTEQVESKGRDDEIVASESWQMHKKRNDSIIVDKFQGQLKSTLICPQCKTVSITFDPYMYLSLPLPGEISRAIDVTLFEPGKQAMKYQVVVPKYASVAELRQTLASMSGISPPHRLIIVEFFSNRIYKYLSDNLGVKSIMDNDVIHAHVIDPNIPIPENIHTMYDEYNLRQLPFAAVRITSKRRQPTNYGSYSVNTIHVGPPFPIFLDKERTTNKDLYDYCFNYLKQYIKEDTDVDFSTADLSQFFPRDPSGKKAQQRNAVKESDRSMDDEENFEKENTDNGAGKGQENNDESDEDEVIEEPKPVFFTLAFEEGYSYGYYDDDNQAALPYNDEVVQIPQKSYSVSNEKKSLNLYLNEAILEKYIDYNKMNDVVTHESAISKSKASGVSLDACIELFTKQEQLGKDDTWYCPNCKEFVQASKKFDIWSLPEVLVIHLKRFQYNRYSRDKLDLYVDYPLDNFDLKPHVLPNPRNQNAVYELFAVSNHYGGLGGGHYTAYAKVSNQWYKFDDQIASKVNPNDVKSSAGYVLFYSRKNVSEQMSDE
jgi:ubiquitin carboxyl-terminal hydrolase 4/11/15